MISEFSRRSRRLTLAVGLAAAIGGLVGAAVPASSTEAAGARPEGAVLYANTPDAVPGAYVVVLKDGAATTDATRSTVDGLARLYGGTVRHTYTAAIKGFALEASAKSAQQLAADPRVAYVAQDQKVSLNALTVQPSPPSWGLDRIDERSLPLDAKFHYPNTAPKIRAFIIDTGIRITHREFGGRASVGVDTVGDGQNGNDCHGHGTHVAGTVGGSTVGVAKQVRLIAVRVLDCGGSGTFAGVVAGVDWVTNHVRVYPGISVANMSLGGGFFQPLNDAVTASIAANVHYSIAAGNSFGADACTASPASTPRATTLGATDITDTRAGFSNIGTCVDVFGPGVNIYSAVATNDTAYASFSGTSMAAPHAAGIAALWRMRFPADNADQVAAALVANATPGVVINPGTGSPNLLLFSGMIPV